MPPGPTAALHNEKFRLATDLLALFGGSDDWANMKACVPMMRRQDKATKDRLTIVTHPGAYHDFDIGRRPPRVFLGGRLEYNEGAAKDSFERTKALFDRRLRN